MEDKILVNDIVTLDRSYLYKVRRDHEKWLDFYDLASNNYHRYTFIVAPESRQFKVIFFAPDLSAPFGLLYAIQDVEYKNVYIVPEETIDSFEHQPNSWDCSNTVCSILMKKMSSLLKNQNCEAMPRLENGMFGIDSKNRAFVIIEDEECVNFVYENSNTLSFLRVDNPFDSQGNCGLADCQIKFLSKNCSSFEAIRMDFESYRTYYQNKTVWYNPFAESKTK